MCGEKHENGSLLREIPYKNGRAEGITKQYYKNENLKETLTYKNNKLISRKCGDGKIPTKTYIHKIETNINAFFEIITPKVKEIEQGGCFKLLRAIQVNR